jgi:hypothetical protein
MIKSLFKRLLIFQKISLKMAFSQIKQLPGQPLPY